MKEKVVIGQSTTEQVLKQNTELGCQIVRPRDFCRILNCSRSAVRAWELAGILPPAHRNGSRFTYWLLTEVQDFLNGKAIAVEGE